MGAMLALTSTLSRWKKNGFVKEKEVTVEIRQADSADLTLVVDKSS